jgi:hypothetical protein
MMPVIDLADAVESRNMCAELVAAAAKTNRRHR